MHSAGVGIPFVTVQAEYLFPVLGTFPPFSYNHTTHLGQCPHKAYLLIRRGLGAIPAMAQGMSCYSYGPTLHWASDLLPGWFALFSSHLLLLDHHLPVPAIIKSFRTREPSPWLPRFIRPRLRHSSELQYYPDGNTAALDPRPHP